MPKHSIVERPGYGTSPIGAASTAAIDTTIVHPASSAAVSSAKGKKRRDSAAPLMSAAPIHNNSLDRSLQGVEESSSNRSTLTGQGQLNGKTDLSYLEAAIHSPNIVDHSTTHSRIRSGLHRRRRRGTAIDDAESDEDSKGETDSEDNDSEDEDSSESGLSSDDDEEQIARQILAAKVGNDKPVSNNDHVHVDLPPRVEAMHPSAGHQRLLLAEEDMELLIEAYTYSKPHLYMYRFSCIFSLGLVWLICRWMPTLWIKWVGCPAKMIDADWFVIQVNTANWNYLLATY
jgi:hypothetical protein